MTRNDEDCVPERHGRRVPWNFSCSLSWLFEQRDHFHINCHNNLTESIGGDEYCGVLYAFVTQRDPLCLVS